MEDLKLYTANTLTLNTPFSGHRLISHILLGVLAKPKRQFPMKYEVIPNF